MAPLWKRVVVIPEKKETETAFHQHLSQLYIFNWGMEYIAEKINRVARSRKPDLYFIASWMRTLLTTVIVYAFEYWALYKISAPSFSVPSVPTFWSFLGFSFGKFTPSSLSGIVPVGLGATLLCYSQLACGLVIFIILIFTILTAARERYHEDITDFVNELQLAAAFVQDQSLSLYGMAWVEVEAVLLLDPASAVNDLRKLRGLPELPVTGTEKAK